jgi:hypothetical protein
VDGLRLDDLARDNSAEANEREKQGAMERARLGRLGEPPVQVG